MKDIVTKTHGAQIASVGSPVYRGVGESVEQLVALLSFLRSRFSDAPPWYDIGHEVRAAREALSRPSIYPAHATGGAPALAGQRETR